MIKKIVIFITLTIGIIGTSYTDVTSNLFQNSFDSSIDSQKPKPTSPNSNKKEFLNKTVAIVNNKAITDLELEREVSKLKASNPNPQFNQNPLDIKRQALQDLISQDVLLQLAEQNNINVSQQQTEAAIKDIAAKNGVSLDSLKLNIEASGMSFDKYKERIHDQLMISQLQQRAISQQVYVSPEEIKKYITKHKAAFDKEMAPIKIYTARNLIIALPKSKKARDRKFNLYKKLATAINKGLIDFKEVAEQFSQAPNASNGGLISRPVTIDAIPEMYKDKVKNVQVHETSQPFEINHTLQMIYVDHVDEQAPLVSKKITRYFVYGIVIKLDGSMNDDGAKNALDRARLAIESGQKFSSIAEKTNQDYDHANGKFGWVSTMDSPPSLPMAAFARLKSLKKRQLSEPFQADAKTWMIIKYTKTKIHNAADQLMEQKALEAIYSEKAQEIYKTWIASMKDDAYVEILEPDLKTPDLY
ncbi:peptidylprolyl isomerase [Francisella sp. Scap27]|uniref:SurA N-terminal domain-containing protein n=1 Tax=Francisella sp. Scap27 TaxID=2589986 RepID=UPI0015BB18EC|nr:SurA N-terminal domain-containing protein [Francisella sp. Scap27]QLE79808.1 peptidylprolyl isomerase [Francisella sp. Scap27]